MNLSYIFSLCYNYIFPLNTIKFKISHKTVMLLQYIVIEFINVNYQNVISYLVLDEFTENKTNLVLF